MDKKEQQNLKQSAKQSENQARILKGAPEPRGKYGRQIDTDLDNY